MDTNTPAADLIVLRGKSGMIFRAVMNAIRMSRDLVLNKVQDKIRSEMILVETALGKAGG